jgi:small-conductance mechanosensitive channel
MVKYITTFLILVIISTTIWIVNFYYQNVSLDRWFQVALVITVSYFVFRILFEKVVAKYIHEKKTKYTFRKVSQILFPVAAILAIIRIWVIDPQALMVAYGLVTAGVAIALQDFFKNFAGGIVILITGLYHVGNRIEINGKSGDVIDIGVLYTTVLEIKEWVDGDQPTGRLSIIPNGKVLSYPVNNYTRDHSFIWDEVSFPITYDSDWKKAVQLMQQIVDHETRDVALAAEESMSNLQERYYLMERKMKPTVFVKATDNWVNITLRYVVLAKERRLFHNEITQRILFEIEAHDDISIASTTVTLTEESTVHDHYKK